MVETVVCAFLIVFPLATWAFFLVARRVYRHRHGDTGGPFYEEVAPCDNPLFRDAGMAVAEATATGNQGHSPQTLFSIYLGESVMRARRRGQVDQMKRRVLCTDQNYFSVQYACWF